MGYVKACVLAVTLTALTTISGAVVYRPTPYGPPIHYRIGGPSLGLWGGGMNQLTLVKVNAGGNYRFGDFCNGFDPSFSLSNIMNLATNGLDRMQQMVVQSLSGALPNLVLWELKKAKPSWYEIMMGVYAFANADVTLGVKSCQQYERDVHNNKHPLSNMFRVAVGDKLKYEASLDEIDLLSALEKAPEDAENEGWQWLGGEPRGGRNTGPVEVNADVSVAGYQVLQGREPTSEESAEADFRLAPLFATPQDVRDFIQTVAGDLQLSFGSVHQGTVGVGVQGAVAVLQQEKYDALQALMAKPPEDVTLADLDLFATNNVALARDDYDRLMTRPVGEQDYYAQLMAARSARAEVVYKLLAAEELLQAGVRVPEVAELKLVKAEVDDTIEYLRSQIDTVIRLEDIAQKFGELPLVLRSINTGGPHQRLLPAALPGRLE